MCCAVLSHLVMSNSLWPHGLQPARLLCPWGFSRQEYWSGLPCPAPGDLPKPGIKPRSPTLQADSLPSESRAEPCGSWSIFMYFTATHKQSFEMMLFKKFPHYFYWVPSLACSVLFFKKFYWDIIDIGHILVPHVQQ